MSAEAFEKYREKIENTITTIMAQAGIPGLGMALVKEDRIIYARGFGARDLKENLPVTPHTLCGIGSCTKSFTALAVMQLAEQGKLNVHDPVKKYLPFKLGTRDNPITIHHLLTHSSGIPNLGAANLMITRMNEIYERLIPLSSFEDLLLHVNGASEEIAARPGKRFLYFNTGYTLLGEIIERVGRMKFEDYVKEKILGPLKMDRSTFLREEFEKDKDIMTPYLAQSKKGAMAIAPGRNPQHKFIYAPGGLISSVIELTNHLIANINGGIFEDTRIVDASSLEEMHKLHIESGILHPNLGSCAKEGYGYGWSIRKDFLGHKLVRHSGSTHVSSAHLSFVPDLKIGVAGVANAGMPPEPVFLGALAILMGKDPSEEIPLFERERKLGLLTGVYETYKGIIKVFIVKKGGLLYVEVKEKYLEASYPLIPETEKMENLKFYIISETGDKIPAEFILGPSGKIDLYIERDRFHKVNK